MKQLIVKVENKFMGEEIYQITMPFNPRKAMIGFYSKYFRNLKQRLSTSEKVSASHIGLKLSVDKIKSNGRVRVLLPSGASLDYPEDVDRYDLSIIIAQLNVMKMPFLRP